MSYRVAVRALCEFAAKSGDLDLRFTPSPTAQEGITGHQAVVARRGADYLAEYRLNGDYRMLVVSGRADGYDPTQNLLEEIKTHRGAVERIPENHRQLHWAQAKVYGWLMCAKRDLEEIELAVVYYNVLSKKETVFRERFAASALRSHYETLCERFISWAEQEVAHRQTRNRGLEQLQFPHPSFRTGQRQLAEAVYRAARDGHCLMAQATTGIGKTLGTIFPNLKAFPGQQLDRLFFLTAKTTGRHLALEALATLREQPAAQPLRILELTARDKACEYRDNACHGESCPLARGFYDRLPAARQAAIEQGWLDQLGLREIALQHEICPYYLAQEMARWSDVVIGDYNYFFDLSALLYSLTVVNDWRVTVLVDEAHNLIERGRSMYSAELDQRAFRTLRRSAPAGLKAALDRVNRHWNQLHRDQEVPYQVYPTAPDLFLLALQKSVSAITDHLTDQPTGNDADLLRFYLDALVFCQLGEAFGDHSLFDIAREVDRARQSTSVLSLRNVVPAHFLAERFRAAHSCTLFSATLSPGAFYADLLGLPEGTPWLNVASPFNSEQLQVRITQDLSTRYQHRAASLQPITGVLARQFAQRPGNYLAFFSSYAYLQQVLERFQTEHPEVPIWVQSRKMDEAERQQFLDRFQPGGRGIGFAVLGGVFGEGVDLPGDRLIGAFIATLGLPQINPVNEQMKQRMQSMFGRGYDYTYLFPGVQKVVQAAGRVIRTTSDSGTLYLLDDRFAQPEVRRLLPGWWSVEAVPCLTRTSFSAAQAGAGHAASG